MRFGRLFEDFDVRCSAFNADFEGRGQKRVAVAHQRFDIAPRQGKQIDFFFGVNHETV